MGTSGCPPSKVNCSRQLGRTEGLPGMGTRRVISAQGDQLVPLVTGAGGTVLMSLTSSQHNVHNRTCKAIFKEKLLYDVLHGNKKEQIIDSLASFEDNRTVNQLYKHLVPRVFFFPP